MGKITVFNHVTVDGFFAGPRGEIDWFKSIGQDDEYYAYTHDQSSSGNTLILGRTTYEMLKSFWPTPEAIKMDPAMAGAVNNSPKMVFSKTLQSVDEETNWKNIKLAHDIDAKEIAKLEETQDMTILGSGSIVRQFSDLGLIDEYCLVVVPIVLGAGKSMFTNVKETNLQLLETRAFKNGLVVHRYQPAK